MGRSSPRPSRGRSHRSTEAFAKTAGVARVRCRLRGRPGLRRPRRVAEATHMRSMPRKAPGSALASGVRAGCAGILAATRAPRAVSGSIADEAAGTAKVLGAIPPPHRGRFLRFRMPGRVRGSVELWNREAPYNERDDAGYPFRPPRGVRKVARRALRPGALSGGVLGP